MHHFRVGDRVRLSELGELRNPRKSSKVGISGRRPTNQDRPASSYCSMAERNRRDCTAVISSGSAIRPKEAVSEKWSPQVMDGRRRSAAARNDHRQCVGYADVCQITTVHRGNQDAYQHAPRAKRSYENKEKGEKAACLTPRAPGRYVERNRPVPNENSDGPPEQKSLIAVRTRFQLSSSGRPLTRRMAILTVISPTPRRAGRLARH